MEIFGCLEDYAWAAVADCLEEAAGEEEADQEPHRVEEIAAFQTWKMTTKRKLSEWRQERLWPRKSFSVEASSAAHFAQAVGAPVSMRSDRQWYCSVRIAPKAWPSPPIDGLCAGRGCQLKPPAPRSLPLTDAETRAKRRLQQRKFHTYIYDRKHDEGMHGLTVEVAGLLH